MGRSFPQVVTKIGGSPATHKWRLIFQGKPGWRAASQDPPLGAGQAPATALSGGAACALRNVPNSIRWNKRQQQIDIKQGCIQ